MTPLGRIAVVAAVSVAAAGVSHAALKTETVTYKQGDAVLEGYLAWDDAKKGPRPGVIVVHEWTGIGPYVKKRAESLAQMGYVAFAADIYGKGIRPQTQQEAAAESGKYKGDRPLTRARVRAAYDQLRGNPNVDSRRIAAIGYCFGGMAALELARSGADIAGVVAFHAPLNSPTPADAKNIKAKVLALHGGDDQYVPAEEVAGFEKEMRSAGVDWQLMTYGGAVHSFTNPESGTDKSSGMAYDPRADRRSWEAMKTFFAEIFK